MCGIFCLLSYNEKPNEPILQHQFNLFKEQISRRGPNSLETENFDLRNCKILLASSVLWLQGTDITVQPHKTDNSVLIYNGDIFGGSQVDLNLKNIIGDTKLFHNALKNSKDIAKTLEHIEGPYAFIYLNSTENRLYIARDIYGRRSLLIGKKLNDFVISSVAKRNTEYNFMELPSIGVFSIDLDTRKWKLFPWRRKNRNFVEKQQELELHLNQTILVESVDFIEHQHFVPPSETHLKMLEDISNHSNLPTGEFFKFLFNSAYMANILKLKELLEGSLRRRILAQPKFCQLCFKQYDCNHAITGILFSGGVDCAVLALLANSIIEEGRSIDLINVAFEKEGTCNTPDRITGFSTLKELQLLCPKRHWNFVEVDVTREELDKCRRERISDLIYPLNSILDDSLGCALWFASRAETSNYRSPCRTLLVGMGADELFGGYTRHRVAIQKKGWTALFDVLEEDWQNLPYRNLARDDRVVSDHGRQLRTPYLDEEVVMFVRNLDCWDKTVPSKKVPQGIGEKLLLRSLAYYLGLKTAATFRKRALQFGSRIANSKEKGHEVSHKLMK